MLIICTQDPNIVAWAQDVNSNAAAWGRLVVCAGSQQQATAQIAAALGALGAGEPVCFSAHGDDNEIGDAQGGWSWSYQDIAAIMAQAMQAYRGNILIHACATQIVNFSAQLAMQLSTLGACTGSWVYGFNRATGVTATYPTPAQLGTSVELNAVQV